MIKKYRKHLVPGLAYLGGIVSLLGFDVLVSSWMPHGDAADWAGIKSFMMIYGPLLLLGLNNLFIRNPERARTILISNIVALCSTTVIMVAVCYVFFKGKFPNSYYLATFLYAISITIMTILRGRMYIISAQVVQGLWKLLLLLFILGYVLAFRDMKLDSVILIFVPLSLLVTVLVGAVIICRSDILKNDGLPLEYFVGKEETQFCLKYIVSVFTAGASAYLEVLVLSVLCSKLQTAEYFSHYTIFTSIAVVFSGYVGFVLTPSIRKLPANYSYLVAGFNAKIFMICVAVFVVSLLVGTVGFLIFYAGRYQLHLTLAILMSGCAVLRILYVFPTAFMGALAESSELNGFVWSGVFGLILMVVVMNLGYLADEIVLSVIIASFCNWLWRTLAAYKYARKLNFISDCK